MSTTQEQIHFIKNPPPYSDGGFLLLDPESVEGDNGAQGQASDIRIQADEILFLKDRLNKELSDRTGQPLDRIQQDTDRDFFMSPTEAVNYGLIDSVIDKRPVQAVA